jgi:L-alanine-DL-glutamate epimerase-like enolase superfamily enzyme
VLQCSVYLKLTSLDVRLACLRVSKPSDVRCLGLSVYFLPIKTRMPIKFGPETLSSVTCARVRMRIESRDGRTAEGWGETPLSVQWGWPSTLPYEPRHCAMKNLCATIAKAWVQFGLSGHPIEIGNNFEEEILPKLLDEANAGSNVGEPMSWLAALICASAFDLALHDAFGNLLQKPVYETYGAEHMNRTLDQFLTPADNTVSFTQTHVCDFLLQQRKEKLPAWHLVGGLDPLDPSDLTGNEPDDGYPVLLRDWIKRDGLDCLKIKLRGNNARWDYDRIARVGKIAIETGAQKLSADFNCTVNEPAYVVDILDRLRADEPEIFKRLLYIEQPFPYDLEKYRIDVRPISARKPLFLDESAHNWKLIRLGRELGWTGVALKTCKTQSGALLSGCWAKAHGMQLMVQDLSNPMLAQIPHLLLAAHIGTIEGVETNGMQFYPEASKAEAAVHSGIYQRRRGMVDLSTLRGSGFGYRLDEMKRQLPPASVEFGT